MATTITTTPKQWQLQAMDFLKALLYAALTTPVTVILSSYSAGTFTINWTTEWQLAVMGAAAYLLQAWGLPSKTVITGANPGETHTITIPPPGTTVTK